MCKKKLAALSGSTSTSVDAKPAGEDNTSKNRGDQVHMHFPSNESSHEQMYAEGGKKYFVFLHNPNNDPHLIVCLCASIFIRYLDILGRSSGSVLLCRTF